MSSISPKATRGFAQRLEEMGVDMLDCSVSGGQADAVNGTLAILCGGKGAVFETFRPLLDTMGGEVTLMDDHGAGQATKLCNRTALAGVRIGMCESLMLAGIEGLDCERVLKMVAGGAISVQLKSRGPQILRRDYSPGFYVHLMQKDLRLIVQAAQEEHISLPGVSTVQQLYNVVQGIEGSREMGSQALILALEQLCNHKVACEA